MAKCMNVVLVGGAERKWAYGDSYIGFTLEMKGVKIKNE